MTTEIQPKSESNLRAAAVIIKLTKNLLAQHLPLLASLANAMGFNSLAEDHKCILFCLRF
jgi:hypothetical protein